MKISTFGLSDRGKVRSRNEDAYLVDDDHRVYAVADGLGGLPSGDLASSMAIQQLAQMVCDSNGKSIDAESAFRAINARIHAEGIRISPEIGIGTTLTVVTIRGESFRVAHVGDCAVFLFRNGHWEQLTIDHTMETEIRSRMKPGETTRIPDYFSHTLTRCIGQQEDIEADMHEYSIQPGDRILICSDGITKTLTEAELLAESQEAATPEAFLSRVIALANARGGPDNATGVAIFFDPDTQHDVASV